MTPVGKSGLLMAMNTFQSVREFVKAAGGAVAVGRICNVSSQAVSQWRSIPIEHCAKIEASGGPSCEEMRPDVDWIRDEAGQVTHYQVRVQAHVQPEQKVA